MRAATTLREQREVPFAGEVPPPRIVTLERAAPAEPWRNPSDMPLAVHQLALACWVAFLGVFWITFAFSGKAEFMVAISTVYAIVFFTVPMILTRMFPAETRKHRDLSAFLKGRFEIFGGSLSGFDALVQVIVVPASLTLGGIAIGFIIHAARLTH